MRRLGSGHSVMFFAPLEVHRRICVVVGRNPDEDVTVHDILRWTMEETCDEIQRYIPRWMQQGVDHEHRMKAAHEFSQNNEDVKILKILHSNLGNSIKCQSRAEGAKHQLTLS